MNILFKLRRLGEHTAVDLLNVLARHNTMLLVADKSVPLLYDSGVIYRREVEEVWSDAYACIEAGHEDCDALSAWRAGELAARGAAALRPGESGYEEAKRLKLRRLRSEVMMTTRTQPGKSGLYHCIVRYQVGSQWYRDDPSARLGMMGGRVDRRVLDRWRGAGVTAKAPLEYL